MVEINQRLFPYSVGVDKDGESGRFIVTISYPNINAIGKNASQEDRVYIVSTNADSLFGGSKELTTRIPYPFYFKHLKVLVFGEELAKDSKMVKSILDGMARDYTINKKIKLMLAEGKAQDLLMVIPNAKRQEVIEGSLFGMLSKGKDTAKYTSQSLTNFIQDTDFNNVALMPRAKPRPDEIKVFGAAIFKDYSYIGALNEDETRVVALVTGDQDKALIEAPFEDSIISFEVSGTKIKKTLIEENNNLKVVINIEMEGKLQEYILREKSLDPTDTFVREMEESIEKCFRGQVEDTIDKLQHEYKADSLRIGEYIQKFHPKIWKRIEKDWDQVFQEIDIECRIDVKLRRRGLVLTR